MRAAHKARWRKHATFGPDKHEGRRIRDGRKGNTVHRVLVRRNRVVYKAVQWNKDQNRVAAVINKLLYCLPKSEIRLGSQGSNGLHALLGRHRHRQHEHFLPQHLVPRVPSRERPGGRRIGECDSAQCPVHRVEKEVVTNFVCGHRYRGSCVRRCATCMGLAEKMTGRRPRLQQLVWAALTIPLKHGAGVGCGGGGRGGVAVMTEAVAERLTARATAAGAAGAAAAAAAAVARIR